MAVNVRVCHSETSHCVEDADKLDRPRILIFLGVRAHIVPRNFDITRLPLAFRDERSFAHLPLEILFGLSKGVFARVLLIRGK